MCGRRRRFTFRKRYRRVACCQSHCGSHESTNRAKLFPYYIRCGRAVEEDDRNILLSKKIQSYMMILVIVSNPLKGRLEIIVGPFATLPSFHDTFQ
mmetsp:Transcript_10743/g.30605  ORF Transcript_10743/g.30605 Transcript_10743/m.30605 type:complete len:96 (-) Transcript_10743:1576-1863(-)